MPDLGERQRGAAGEGGSLEWSADEGATTVDAPTPFDETDEQKRTVPLARVLAAGGEQRGDQWFEAVRVSARLIRGAPREAGWQPPTLPPVPAELVGVPPPSELTELEPLVHPSELAQSPDLMSVSALSWLPPLPSARSRWPEVATPLPRPLEEAGRGRMRLALGAWVGFGAGMLTAAVLAVVCAVVESRASRVAPANAKPAVRPAAAGAGAPAAAGTAPAPAPVARAVESASASASASASQAVAASASRVAASAPGVSAVEAASASRAVAAPAPPQTVATPPAARPAEPVPAAIAKPPVRALGPVATAIAKPAVRATESGTGARATSAVPAARAPTAGGPAVLEAVDEVVVRATRATAGQLRRVAVRGSALQPGDALAEVRRANPQAARKLRALNELLEQYEGADDHTEELARARADYQRAADVTVTATVRARSAGIVVGDPVPTGRTIERGDELVRVAPSLRLQVPAGDVDGSGANCRVTLRERPSTTLAGKLLPSALGARSRSITIGRFPASLTLGPIGRVHADCR